MTPGSNRPPLPITACVRTKNEEDRLGRCLIDARQIASEVLVVDSGSTDGTVDVARSLGARVIEQPWLGNGLQKRVGEEAASNDWILDLDADEYVTPRLAEEIYAAFSGGEPSERLIFSIPMHTLAPSGDVWTNWNTGRRLKLYNRRHVRVPEHPEWDQLAPPAGSEIRACRGTLLHESFRDLEHLVAKLNRSSSSRCRNAKPKPPIELMARIVGAYPLYFLKAWLLRGYCMNGWYGLLVASTLARGRWLRDAKMLERRLCERAARR